MAQIAPITPLQSSIDDEVRMAGPNHLQALLGILTILKIEEPEITEGADSVVVRVGGVVVWMAFRRREDCAER